MSNLIKLYPELLPGFLTKLAGRLGSVVTLDPALGARTSLYCALEPDLETGGREALHSELDTNNVLRLLRQLPRGGAEQAGAGRGQRRQAVAAQRRHRAARTVIGVISDQ